MSLRSLRLTPAIFLLVTPLVGCESVSGLAETDGETETDDGDDDDADDDDRDDDDDESTTGPSETTSDATSGPTGPSSDTDPDDTDTDDPETTGEPEDVDHALGVISLTEAHATSGGTATGAVSAVFIPDAAAAVTTCSRTVSGCEISMVPSCESGCGDGEYCGFDSACESSCLDFCDAACDEDEECYFAAPGQSACRGREDFDAGSLSFSGTSTPITLFPPYVAEGFETGSPFLPGADITVSAGGATGAGFEGFEASFTATSLLRTELEDISVGEAYGEGPMPVRWSSGEDELSIVATVTSVGGAYGVVTCAADDSSGAFDVPRNALLAAVDDEVLDSIAVTVTRRRVEVDKDLATTGELLGAEVQSIGWLELATASSESHVIEGCGFGELVCNDECTDVLSDLDNCGDCDDPCNGECVDGVCFGSEDDDVSCDDGLDNDDDGFIDCQDFSCSANPEVTVCDQAKGDENTNALCSDGDDNDGDGFIDCVDFDCSMNPNVTVCVEDTNALCDDGVDNDGDNFIDCDDFDCSMNPNVTVCEETGSSCAGACGDIAPSGLCYCDTACVANMDCCSDYAALCV